jgi:predicted dehydrogenase/threonine dehydrogenase-like Zn-dependent dehydrogenase
MRQVIRRGLKEMIVDEVPDPEIPSHHVLIRPVCSLISSGTETASIHTSVVREVVDNPSQVRKVLDVMKQQGPIRTLREVRAKFSEYAVLGYSGAGVVAQVHPSIRDLPLGTRVAYGGEGTGHGECVVTGRNLVAVVPDALGMDAASFATLGSIALNAVRIASLSLGESAAVIGLGLVGQLVAQLARRQGARVVAIDLLPERVQLARRLGAEHGLVGGEGVAEQVRAATGGQGVDVAIVAAAAKSPRPCQDALALIRDRGRIVVLGEVEMSFPRLEMYLKEVQLNMARAYGPGSYDPVYERQGVDYPIGYVRWTENRNMEEFLRLVAERQVDVQPLITHRFPLERAPEGYETIMTRPAETLAVVLDYPRTDAQLRVEPYRPTTRVEVNPAPAGTDLAIALIGASNIARWEHAPAIRATAGATLRAVYSGNGARAKSCANRFGAAYCTSLYEDILADRSTHAVLISSRNPHHARQTIAALEAGKHVFVEKPMALTDEECIAIRAAERASTRVVAVGFNRRFAPYYRAVKERLARRSGPAVLSCRMNSPGMSGSFWAADPANGGAILGEACHFVDLFYWLLESEPLTVAAFSLPARTAEPIGANNLAVSFQFADGSIANLTYCTVGHRKGGGERLEVFAPGITVATEDFKRLRQVGALPPEARKFFADKGYREQMAGFVRAMRGQPSEVATAIDGARATIGCLRMLESAADGGTPKAIDLSVLG